MKCYIVRDLLPGYMDDLVGEETKRDMDEHLKDCGECRALYEQLRVPIPKIQTDDKEINYLKKIRKRTVRNILIVFAALIIGFSALAWVFAIGSTAKSDDVIVKTEFQYNTVYTDNIPHLNKEWVIHFELTNGKALKADTKYLFRTDENGIKSVTGCIITLYEVQPSALLFETDNYTFGYSHYGDGQPLSDQLITVRYKDTKVVYSMIDEGL
ncbi:MAG: zf-HC2 domain-containing protein [Oscillospiraceae bacterium]|nr:zf-HC2 domain-containing protein [Oscillospiraceae bacterium]